VRKVSTISILPSRGDLEKGNPLRFPLIRLIALLYGYPFESVHWGNYFFPGGIIGKCRKIDKIKKMHVNPSLREDMADKSQRY
jgi:hypothetical protein